MNAVARFCDRAMLLERGDMVAIDDPVVIGRRYHELNFNRSEKSAPAEGEERYGDQAEAEIADVWFEQPAGARQEALLSGERADICLEIWTRETLRTPSFNVELRNEAGLPLFVASSQYQDDLPEQLEGGRRYIVRLRFDCLLGPGRFACTPALLRGLGAEDIVDLRPGLASVMVHAVDATGGLVALPHEFAVDPL